MLNPLRDINRGMYIRARGGRDTCDRGSGQKVSDGKKLCKMSGEVKMMILFQRWRPRYSSQSKHAFRTNVNAQPFKGEKEACRPPGPSSWQRHPAFETA